MDNYVGSIRVYYWKYYDIVENERGNFVIKTAEKEFCPLYWKYMLGGKYGGIEYKELPGEWHYEDGIMVNGILATPNKLRVYCWEYGPK